MARILTALAVFGVVACSSLRPPPVQAGDVCFRCRRPIADARFAGVVISTSGKPMKFRAPLCMAKYLVRNPANVAAIYVTDYPTGRMLLAKNATFVKFTIDPDTNEREYVAFRSAIQAGQFIRTHGGGAVEWWVVQRAASEATE